MSIDSAKAFIEKLKNDENFRKELKEMTSADERMKFAKAHGFDFTKEQIGALIEALTDEDLDAVTGGIKWYCFIVDTT